ncbi:MAG TPA: 30S ribosomal protein S8 [Gaiellaceae bacterium]|jgi:small subunit ribosomal protein S8|nr:30S ribosomal protein S8 [Gaiellaceae bacterium]
MVKLATNVNDPVGDLLTRVRNANLAFKDDLVVPASKMNRALLQILTTEGYVAGFGEEGEGIERVYRVTLKYDAKRQRTISGIKRVSKPGRRVYAGHDDLPRVLGGLGVAIISTSHGVMTDRDASREGIGGEVLAYVW